MGGVNKRTRQDVIDDGNEKMPTTGADVIDDEGAKNEAAGADVIDEEKTASTITDADISCSHDTCQIPRENLNLEPTVYLTPTNWIREDVIFFSEHGPFPAYRKSFHLSDSGHCSCGGTGTELHYATECALTVSWQMRRPAPN
ncbi:hypothetical protein AVEN_268792-1 [Araneus ventricosus]|uniref:Uncharacterized protein n=1 Tax=Araneus ventricosus TaxID=182803 RepID=A0A4Y2UTJ4_ARAVE|nr:hypothetical protein AVEN_268792-1 [Araneus ventricosus]